MLVHKKNNPTNTFLLVMAYGLLFYCIQFFIYKADLSAVYPNAVTLERWDAGIYHIVAKTGYFYRTEGDNNAGLYILFPWVWKLLHLAGGGGG